LLQTYDIIASNCQSLTMLIYCIDIDIVCLCPQSILKKLHAESLHLLSLSDLRFLRGLGGHQLTSAMGDRQMVDAEPWSQAEPRTELAAAQQSWNEEKKCLLASIESLKKLLALVPTHGNVRKVSSLMASL